jgi:hypothetical protein
MLLNTSTVQLLFTESSISFYSRYDKKNLCKLSDINFDTINSYPT